MKLAKSIGGKDFASKVLKRMSLEAGSATADGNETGKAEDDSDDSSIDEEKALERAQEMIESYKRQLEERESQLAANPVQEEKDKEIAKLKRQLAEKDAQLA